MTPAGSAAGSAGGTFPGGTSVTLLDVYDDAAPDGVVGGTPHMHLASTECYVVVGGQGELHTITLEGVRETPLAEGSVVWFTPGTIHRAVNHGGLRVLVIMGNAGLPEAGDAVMTFPAGVVADEVRYRDAATLPIAATQADRAVAASTRRDLAVAGYTVIRDAMLAGDDRPLREFHAAAAALVRSRAADWEAIVGAGPLAQAERSIESVRALTAGSFVHLADAALAQAPEPLGERGFGMCGRLRAYDVGGQTVRLA